MMMRKRVTIRFYVKKKLDYGQNLRVCGSVQGLGNWSTGSSILMNWNENDWWCGEFQFEATSNLPKNNFKLDTSSYYYKNAFSLDGSNNGSNSNSGFIDQQKINSLFSNNKKNNKLLNDSSSDSSANNSLIEGELSDDEEYFLDNNAINNNNNNNNYSNRNNSGIEDYFGFSNKKEEAKKQQQIIHSMSSFTLNHEDCNGFINSNNSSFNGGGGNGYSSNSSTTSGGSSMYQLNNSQSLSPSLKGTSPQLIEFDYKYVYSKYDDFIWETGRNHKVSFMLWSNDFSNEEEEIYIEIRDIFDGGCDVFPTLDYRSINKSNSTSPLQTSTNSTNQMFFGMNDLNNKYLFLQPLESQIIPRFPSQIVTFFVMNEGDSEFHSINLVSQFFGTDSQKSLRMYPVTRAGFGAPNTLWIGQIYSPQPMKFEYHYVVTSSNNQGIYWEKEKRTFSTSNNNDNIIVNNDGMIRYSDDVSQGWIKTGYVGLLEQDENCSISCVVQLLYHIKPLRQVIKNLGGKIGFPFTQCLAKIFTLMEMGFNTIDINPLPSSIGSNDSAEILEIVLNELLQEINTISKNTNNSQLKINSIFEGEVQNTFVYIDKDGRIESIKTKNETFNTIILPVKGFSSLEQSLKFYRHSEERPHQHDIDHNDNGGLYETMNDFITIPDILIFQLDRTDYDNRRTIKVSNTFSFPKSLEITSNNGDRSKFKILGIVCHSGGDFYSGGHFFLFIQMNKYWYRFDGSKVLISNYQEAVINNFGGNNTNQNALLTINIGLAANSCTSYVDINSEFDQSKPCGASLETSCKNISSALLTCNLVDFNQATFNIQPGQYNFNNIDVFGSTITQGKSISIINQKYSTVSANSTTTLTSVIFDLTNSLNSFLNLSSNSTNSSNKIYIYGITFRNGNLKAHDGGFGGSVLANLGTGGQDITFDSCIFQNNLVNGASSLYGGSIVFSNNKAQVNPINLNIKGCTYQNTFSNSIKGGFIYIDNNLQVNLTITQSLFTNFYGTTGGLVYYASVQSSDSSLFQFTNSSITLGLSNAAFFITIPGTIENINYFNNIGGVGFGIASTSYINTFFNNCQFTSNSETTPVLILQNPVSVVFNGCIFKNNNVYRFSSRNPAITVNEGTASINNCSFTNNNAINGGTGQVSFGTDNTFENNVAVTGSTIYCKASQMDFRNNQISFIDNTDTSSPNSKYGFGCATSSSCTILGTSDYSCSASEDSNKKHLTGVQIAFIVIGVLVGVVIIGFIVIKVARKVSQNNYKPIGY
ncbi:hypothetical protein DICPUDRAFT_146635 [Dictyostelium purpureum]|uniref:USP domain-containing protein n=1 Tax=Dictyostelium purpureum TaxID=5786 RepID=F0Z6H3_DICPU|nr:uncharacterized protein DICPUDRAFT_146635 [Dictyostelium purpureum]EGC40491.1 hypothetical protein DICPUDRAFT_146635 [Dictyostelium purpureum]|eukprot:XP_003283038.1 hypothetical protein DICPUDRAFT_146635 [Dictyostelium purpureum]